MRRISCNALPALSNHNFPLDYSPFAFQGQPPRNMKPCTPHTTIPVHEKNARGCGVFCPSRTRLGSEPPQPDTSHKFGLRPNFPPKTRGRVTIVGPGTTTPPFACMSLTLVALDSIGMTTETQQAGKLVFASFHWTLFDVPVLFRCSGRDSPCRFRRTARGGHRVLCHLCQRPRSSRRRL